jgi:S-adenosylmethionine decarboxylase
MNDTRPFAIHLCATLIQCDLRGFCGGVRALDSIKQEVCALVDSFGFKRVTDAFHFFAPHAVTGAVCLAESHLCFHSWPESNLVYLDIFACSRKSEVQASVERLMRELASRIFKAGHVDSQWIVRT